MKSLLYISLTRLKNRFKGLLKNPGMLILLVIILGAIFVPMFLTNSSEIHINEYRDIKEVYAMITALYGAGFIMVCYSGLSKGASLYSMADVNLVFTAPLTPEKVLIYGLVQQMGTSLLVGLFLIFQYGWMNSTYGISMMFIIFILLGYALIIFCSQLTAMVAYALTSGSAIKREIAKMVLIVISGVTIIYVLIPILTGEGQLLPSVVAAFSGFPVTLFPVGGWAQIAIIGLWTGNFLGALYGLGGILLYIGALILLMMKVKPDFYEDVLKSTEASFGTIMASKEGRIDQVMTQNVKLGTTGIRKGLGADAFYYKHRLESRRARSFIVDRTSLLFILFTVVFALFVREAGIISVFIFATYMQIFSVSLGRWVRELSLPYVYLVPEAPFTKLFNCLRESIFRITVEAIILFIPIAFILKLNVGELVFCILARISFGMLFTSGKILMERFFSAIAIKMVTIIIYMVVMLILVLPGVVLAFIATIAGVTILAETVQIFAILSTSNIIVALIVIYLSKNMLEYAELNDK